MADKVRSRSKRRTPLPRPPSHPHASEPPSRDFALLLLIAAAGILFRPALLFALLYALIWFFTKFPDSRWMVWLRARLARLHREQARRGLIYIGTAGILLLLLWLYLGASG